MSDPLTLEIVEAAIVEVLETGEAWQIGDTSRKLSLEQLIQLRDRMKAAAAASGAGTAIAFSLVSFGAPQKEA